MLGLISLAIALQVTPMPIRGLHFFAPSPADIPITTKFIREELPKQGVNTLVVEFDFNYQFKKRKEMADNGALSEVQIKEIVSACKDAHVRLIPQINLLGHQSWDKNTGKLLTAHPEFDETPGKYPDNKGIYCRSYCPNHPEVHKVLFDCIDELADVCEADAFHVGMDEVFIVADKDCPRCGGKPTADVFAEEVTRLHDHLKATGRQMWMWGDRFLDGESTGLGEWEASTNKTFPAISKVQKDIVICDWHYEKPEPTAPFFAMNGFQVVTSPWRDQKVASGQLAIIKQVREGANKTLANRMQGILHTTWVDAGAFIRAYNGDPKASKDASESAACFKKLCAEMNAG
ncbi:family 20 glycosylhydrolase [soil metagenome]